MGSQGQRSAAEVAAHVTRSIGDAIRAAGENPYRVAQATKIARSTLERKLAGLSDFTVLEAAAIAEYLRVDPAGFYPRPAEVAA